MEHEVIAKLREIAATPHNPRNTDEWPMPVKPSDLLILFEHYDNLLAANELFIKLFNDENYDELPTTFS